MVASLPDCCNREVTSAEMRSMRMCARQVQAAALYYRPGARCLPQAIAIARLLRRRGYPVSLVIAVRRFPFAAHAWVECDGQVLSDRQAVRREFTALVESLPIVRDVEATP